MAQVLRYYLWRALTAAALLCALAPVLWLADGDLARLLREGTQRTPAPAIGGFKQALQAGALSLWRWAPLAGVPALQVLLWGGLLSGVVLALVRCRARARRRYVRLRVEPYRTDRAQPEALVSMFEALHARIAESRVRRILLGQPSLALEAHFEPGPSSQHAWLAVTCPQGLERLVETALRSAYPNCRLRPAPPPKAARGALVRLRKQSEFIRRAKTLERRERDSRPPIDGLLTVMAACAEPCSVQLALTPAGVHFESLAKRLHAERETARLRQRAGSALASRRTMLADAELRGGLELLNTPLFFADIRVLAASRRVCRRIAAEICSAPAENRLVEHTARVCHGLLGLYARRIARGEGNAFPTPAKELYAAGELAALWQLPSLDYAAVPLARSSVPVAPAPPGVARAAEGEGMLRDEYGPVTIAVALRKQNTAVPGTVEQGKTSFLVATVAEDLRRERCAVIVLDPKGDAAESAVSLVPLERACILLDFAHPTCGFNPLAVDAPADVIADYVVAALRNLFSDADIRASSDRYLRNALIAVLAHDRSATLWDAARLLSVGEDGYAFRRRVAAAVRGLPEFKEISEFFAAELSAQLADARSTTTAKLDAPVNKLARLLNSPSIKRILLNDSLKLDFDRIISERQVLVVKGALGAMGAGNTSVLMQLLVGMLDAALARQQDLVEPRARVAVALKIDEAPLVLNRGFAETMALKRSAGLETVACWQTDAQWVDRDVREQLDALFAHRVYFATASTRDARSAAALTMPEFSDSVRAGLSDPAVLGRPDVRLHLPRHHAIASWSTFEGRQAAFVAQTLPLRVDRERLLEHARLQRACGARHLTDLRQPHWDRVPDSAPSLAEQPRASAEEGAAGEARSRASAPLAVAAAEEARPSERPPPSKPAESYRELVELDRAQSVRWARVAATPGAIEPDSLDIEMLALVASFGHVLSSQLHRCFNSGRAATTTQRRLKRLSDAGLVERLQFHRSDGGGVPMCYLVTTAAAELLEARGRALTPAAGDAAAAEPPRSRERHAGSAKMLRQARHDAHVAGYALALAGLLGKRCSALRGAREAVLSPPRRSARDAHARLGPDGLRLPGGCTPHAFLRTLPDGRRVEVEHFDTVRPDAILELEQLELMIEIDDRLPLGADAAKLERYDHFLSGWSLHTSRYGARGHMPRVIIVCRDAARAREYARAADAVLGACRAYPGEYPFDWSYPGREAILFAAERDAHEGLARAYGVARLPPAVRVVAAHGDPAAAEAEAQPRELAAQI
jgi:hypothetical protein